MNLTLFLNIFLVPLAVTADGRCVGATDGIKKPATKKGKVLRIAFSFGLFQMLKPAIGVAVVRPFEATRKVYIP